ncbi:MAG: substrate-binding domain-containing protein [Oscillospiraceae bacterium]|nr:substrate-binding domain-containing protein [Oscillospiraceae bacterium]
MKAKYMSVAKDITKEIRLMQQTGIKKLPSETKLAEKYCCSRQTIRTALALLEKRGLVVKCRGSGSYLAETANSSRLVAVVLQDKSEYIYPRIVRDLQNSLSGKGYTLRCYNTNGRLLNERTVLTALLECPPAGIVIEALNNVLCSPNLDLLEQIEAAGIPLVFVHCKYERPAAAVCISEDDYGGAYGLVKYLAAKGHRNIAGIMKSDDSRGLERYRGCVRASLDLSLEFSESNYYWLSSESRRCLLNDSESILPSFIKDYLNPCTAVICYNDEIAFHLIRALRMNGILIPEDVSIVSFDNSYYATAGPTGITSLGHEPHAAGSAAAEALLALMSGRSGRSAVLSWSLNERESS